MHEKSVNLWMLRFNNSYQFSIIENIIKKSIRVSLVTGNFETFELLSQFKENNAVDVDFIDNNKVCALKHKRVPIGDRQKDDSLFFNDKLYKAYYFAIQLLERHERFSGDLSFEERNYIIYKQVEFWNEKIKLNRPSSVIFMDIPHMYYELVLLALCEVEKIPCMMISYTPNHDKIILLNHKFELISGYGGGEFNEINKDYLSMARNHLQKDIDVVINSNHTRPYFLLKTLVSFFYGLLMHKNRKYEKGYYIKTGFFEFGLNSVPSERFNELLYAWNSIYFRLLYKNISSPVEFDCDYVYFPLVSGYENSFHPSCSPLNIFIILDYISRVVPEDCFIYVKEHPAQFKFRSHQRFSRSKKMYDKIKNMDKVKLININADHYKLISKSRFVVGSSMSSTAYQTIAKKKIYKYYGLNILPSDYAHPLFGGSSSYTAEESLNYFHKEIEYMGLESDSKSIANKIIDWSSNQIIN